ncbi:hypothetical protein [Halostagnicola bangensis]
MSVETVPSLRSNRPGGSRLRLAFFITWFADLVASVHLFLVPYAHELNPITVMFYEFIGLPGVVLAAVTYAVVIIAVGYVLSSPFDVGFVTIIVSAYAFFASNNIVLLVFREPLLDMIII